MELQGFKCSDRIDSPFGGRQHLNYLYCERNDGGTVVDRRWQVALVLQDSKVDEVLITSSLAGPLSAQQSVAPDQRGGSLYL